MKGAFGVPKNLKEKMEELACAGTGNELRLPHIELDSNREATVEGCFGIIEYESSFVRLNCRGITVKFSGDGICINNLSNGLVCVTGQFVSIEFGN